MKKNRLFAILIAFFTFSCFAQNWKADHVFLIGLDGWGAYSVEKAADEGEENASVVIVRNE